MGDRLTLTRQNYATPYGVLPTDTAIVDALVAAIGPEQAFAGELRHRGEHSLELVATWLHHMRGGQPVDMVPILTGSFGDFVVGRGDPASDARADRLSGDTLQQTDRRPPGARRRLGRPVARRAGLWRPADGRRRPRAHPGQADAELMQQMAEGSAAGFFAAIRREQDRNNVCGVSPFYLMLSLLGDVEGQILAYDQCPADQRNTSLVSVCGMVFG